MVAPIQVVIEEENVANASHIIKEETNFLDASFLQIKKKRTIDQLTSLSIVILKEWKLFC